MKDPPAPWRHFDRTTCDCGANAFSPFCVSLAMPQARYRPQVSVSGGHAVITASVLGLPLQETRDVCSEVNCPVLKGKVRHTAFLYFRERER